MNGLMGFMDFSLFKDLIEQITPYPDTILVLHRRGESLLHPEFIHMMSYILGRFETVQLATNATLINKEKALAMIQSITFLSFSIDTPSMFNKTRIPAKYEAVEANILMFLEMNNKFGNPVHTQVSMVRTENTPDKELYLFEKVWKERVERVRIYDEHSTDGNFGSLKQKRTKRLPCTMPFYEMLIYSDGTIGRCNHDWDGKPLGDIRKRKIREIWHDSIYQNLRDQHETSKIIDPVCALCDSWYPEEGHQGTGRVIEK